jgi:small-conductance mechanosensitive channel
MRAASPLFVVCLALAPCLAFAQDATIQPNASADEGRTVATAPVVVDGRALFSVRGIRDFPAATRAQGIERQIRALAADRTFNPDSLPVVPREGAIWIGPPGRSIVRVTDADAELDGVDKAFLAEVYAGKIRSSIVSWRAARTPGALRTLVTSAAVATGLALIPFLLLRWLLRLVDRWDIRSLERARGAEPKKFQLFAPDRISALVRGLLKFALGVGLAIVAFLYLQYVLSLSPWTWGLGDNLRGWVLAPLLVFGRGLVAIIPNLIFLAAVVLIVRYLLGLIRLYFQALGRGDVTLPGFYSEWAAPTYNILRLVVIAFALVMAYPYIPGANSEAFKGVSLFMAAIFSLSSTSVVSNVIAGYALIYRRVFREGDLVRIGDVTGFVSRIRLQVTHVRTPKNEEVVIPNSTILNSDVVNYHALSKERGLILHTIVGIGYETPWRQVEAMLLEAAARTPELKREPPPYVLQRELGDFAVKYEINAYCDTPERMLAVYSALHGNILDLFNEHGVQIMTPAYEGDPEQPKVVARTDWHLPPATPPADGAGAARPARPPLRS